MLECLECYTNKCVCENTIVASNCMFICEFMYKIVCNIDDYFE